MHFELRVDKVHASDGFSQVRGHALLAAAAAAVAAWWFLAGVYVASRGRHLLFAAFETPTALGEVFGDFAASPNRQYSSMFAPVVWEIVAHLSQCER